MTYDVLKDFTDEDFKVNKGDDEKVALSKSAGEKFIPAEVGYPANRVEKLVLNGTLRLIERPAAEEPGTSPSTRAKKK